MPCCSAPRVGVHSAGRRAAQVPGLRGRAGRGGIGLVVGRPRADLSRPVHRLVGPGQRKNRHLLAYNSRFLMPPWVEVPHLASHVLGRMARLLPVDWQRLYGHPVYFLETFVDPTRHRGTCYRAANWIVLGQTFGRGHRCPTMEPNRPVKLVLGYPLIKSFRELLGGCRAQIMPEPRHEVESGSHRAG